MRGKKVHQLETRPHYIQALDKTLELFHNLLPSRCNVRLDGSSLGQHISASTFSSMTLDDPAGRTSSTHLVACHPRGGGGSHLFAMPLKLNEANVSANFQTSLHTRSRRLLCLVFFWCLSLFLCVFVCVCLYVSFLSLSLFSHCGSSRLGGSLSTSQYRPCPFTCPTPPPPFRTASPERSQIADCRTCVRQSPFTSFFLALWDLPYTHKKTWCELPSVLPAQSHARTSSSLACILRARGHIHIQRDVSQGRPER